MITKSSYNEGGKKQQANFILNASSKPTGSDML